MDQGLPQLVQVESIEKSNSFERETSQFNAKIVKDEKNNLKIVFRKISDDGEMDQIEVIEDDNSNPHSSKNEANLMRVPSPQQIQYLNPLDGEEMTIQKQPNTTPHHVLSERFKKTNSYEKKAPGPNAEIDKIEVVDEEGASENSEMKHVDVIKDDPFKDEKYTDSSIGEKKVKIQYYDVWENYFIIFLRPDYKVIYNFFIQIVDFVSRYA